MTLRVLHFVGALPRRALKRLARALGYARYRQLKTQGLVLEEDYARHYLGSPRLRSLSRPHYFLLGERKGNRPNPFFDPHHFAKATGGAHRSIIDYVNLYAEADISPSREFEHAWYAQYNPRWSRRYPHPFLHYWSEGLSEHRSPVPGFDMGGLLASLNAGAGDAEAKGVLFRQILQQGVFDQTFGVYTPEELERAQNAFRSSIVLRVHREPPPSKRRFLVFVQAGRSFDGAFAKNPAKERDYDIFLNFYDGPPGYDWPGIEVLASQAGTKATAISTLLERRPDLLMPYDATFFLDDDIELSTPALSQFFAEMEKGGLDLAQPSLTPDSPCAWDLFKQPRAGPATRRVTGVEIMMPALSRFALDQAGWTFGQSISGWGVDLLLGDVIVRELGRRAGVIGSVVARHERPIDYKAGSFYSYLQSVRINPRYEYWMICKKFGIEDKFRYLDEIGTDPNA